VVEIAGQTATDQPAGRRESLVRVALIAGEFLAEPVGRLEAVAGVDRRKLDLGDD
jgi:hypothetical protein